MEAFLYPLFWLAVIGLIALVHYSWHSGRLKWPTRKPRANQLAPPQKAAPGISLATQPPALEGSPQEKQRTSTRRAKVDLVKNTLDALAVLPPAAPVPPDSIDPLHIPIFFCEGVWDCFKIGEQGHLAIIGTSGSGKGNFLRGFILKMLKAGPARLQVAIFDSKSGVDYWWAKHIPHCTLYRQGREVMEKERVDHILTGLQEYARIMYERNDALMFTECENIHDYNAKVRGGRIEGEEWPFLVLVCDEVADFSGAAKEIIETLARMSRAAGFMLIVATQHPTNEALGSQAKRNLHSRLVFMVDSSQGTHVALGRTSKDIGLYEPSAINRPGVAIWRRNGGQETIGLVEYLSAERRDELIHQVTAIQSFSNQ